MAGDHDERRRLWFRLWPSRGSFRMPLADGGSKAGNLSPRGIGGIRRHSMDLLLFICRMVFYVQLDEQLGGWNG
jgi:hypothetical protein